MHADTEEAWFLATQVLPLSQYSTQNLKATGLKSCLAFDEDVSPMLATSRCGIWEKP